jgi:UDP-N-acetylglucosamine 2-epimerase (non-hydrolysing)
VAGALAEVLEAEPSLRLVFVAHPNTAAREPAVAALSGQQRALVVDALGYPAFIGLVRNALVAVTDSGGLQEEGPTLGVPVLVTRTVTERPEGVAAGAVELVGTNAATVRDRVLALVRDRELRARMANAGRFVYGDGHAAERVADVLVAEVDT